MEAETITLNLEDIKEMFEYRASIIGGSAEYSVKEMFGDLMGTQLMQELKNMFGEGWYPIPEFQKVTSGCRIIIKPKKMDQVGPWIATLRGADFKRSESLWEQPDFGTNTPMWTFKRGEYCTVYLRADFSENDPEDGESCMLVKVGTKVVDEMRLICPSDPDYDKYVNGNQETS